MIGETIHRHISVIILYQSLVSKSSDKGNENNTTAFLQELWGVGEERTPSIANGLLLLFHTITPDTATSSLVLPSSVEPIVSCISYLYPPPSAGLLLTSELDHSSIPVGSNHCLKTVFPNLVLPIFHSFGYPSGFWDSVFIWGLALSLKTNG